MKLRERFELPEELEPVLARARKLEWLTLFLLATIVAAIYLTMGSSQAMKAAWVEDLLSFIPPIAFLISIRYAERFPNERFPYGYHRAVSIAFLAGSVALSILGLYILTDSALGLVRREHPSVGTTVLFGRQFWSGWLMVAALGYSMVPPVVLGRMKLEPARNLHDKTLKADADMNKADWLTAAAGIAGILGIGLGWWWADSVAALVISVAIVHDGFSNLTRVVSDLMDQKPTTVEGDASTLPEQVRRALSELPWVADAAVRLREEGHVLVGEAFLVVRDDRDMTAKFQEAAEVAQAVDWRVHDLVLTVVSPEALAGNGRERVGRSWFPPR